MLTLRLALSALRLSLPLSLLMVGLALALGQHSDAPMLAFFGSFLPKSNTQKSSNLYVMDIVTRVYGLISPHEELLEHTLAWWPDGQSLLIQKDDLSYLRLSVDGRHQEALPLPANAREVRPAQRDQTFAYLAPLASGVDELWLQVGGEQRNLSQTPTAWESRPNFSSDGRWLAWLSYQQGVGYWLMAYDLEAQTRYELLNSTNYVDGPSWASDGRLLALEGNLTTWAEALIWDEPMSAPARLRVPTHLTPGEIVWSPQVDKVAYVRPIKGLFSVWLYDLRTGDERQLTPEGIVESFPAWSRDGRWLALGRQDARRSARLVLWDMQGMSHRLLTGLYGHSGVSWWSP